MEDVLIIGGGPAGLSAALVLGRALKRVRIVDGGTPRNAAAHAVNGFLGFDGAPPREMRARAHRELAPYGVTRTEGRVAALTGTRGAFESRLDDGSRIEARRVLIATGMIDEVSERPGFRALWGKSVFICPYCHGYEVRDRALAMEMLDVQWLEHALFLAGWSRDLIVYAPPDAAIPDDVRAKYAAAGVRLETRAITALRGDDRLEALVLDDGEVVPRDALFTRPPQRQTALVTSLGLALTEQGFVSIDATNQTSVAGIYAAGDLTTMMQSAMLSAADGARAAAMLNHELTLEQLRGRSSP